VLKKEKPLTTDFSDTDTDGFGNLMAAGCSGCRFYVIVACPFW
jgi:hypothetical protein